MYGAEVHIWLVDVDDGSAVQRALDFLPEDERTRLGMQLQPKRRRSICAQAALRILVAVATTGALPLPELVRGWNGKPMLEAWGHLDDGRPLAPLGPPAADPGDGGAPRPLHVSLSHSGALAAIALSTAGLTGVDVEQVQDRPDNPRLARSMMSDFEYLQWCCTTGSRRTAALFRAWTRKEAVLKALGTGLGGGLARVSAPLGPVGGRRLAMRGLPADAGPPGEWSVHDLPGRPGYAAAVAVRTPRTAVHQHEMGIGELLHLAHPVSPPDHSASAGTRRGGPDHARHRRTVDAGNRG